MSAASLDFLLAHYASIHDVERAFSRIVRCTCCERLLSRELVYRRAYSLSGGACCLAVLCGTCDEAIPTGSDAEGTFRQRLEAAAAAAFQLRKLQ